MCVCACARGAGGQAAHPFEGAAAGIDYSQHTAVAPKQQQRLSLTGISELGGPLDGEKILLTLWAPIV